MFGGGFVRVGWGGAKAKCWLKRLRKATRSSKTAIATCTRPLRMFSSALRSKWLRVEAGALHSDGGDSSSDDDEGGREAEGEEIYGRGRAGPRKTGEGRRRTIEGGDRITKPGVLGKHAPDAELEEVLEALQLRFVKDLQGHRG